MINEGVGLRQVMDHHFIMRQLAGADRSAVRDAVRSLGLGRLGGALEQVETTLFGAPGCPGLFAPEPRRGAHLLEDVLLSGNFGRGDSRGGGKRARFFRFLTDYPSEVLWSPFWKVWHRIWRKRMGYL